MGLTIRNQERLENLNIAAMRNITGCKVGTLHHKLYEATNLQTVRSPQLIATKLSLFDAYHETHDCRINKSHLCTVSHANPYSIRHLTPFITTTEDVDVKEHDSNRKFCNRCDSTHTGKVNDDCTRTKNTTVVKTLRKTSKKNAKPVSNGVKKNQNKRTTPKKVKLRTTSKKNVHVPGKNKTGKKTVSVVVQNDIVSDIEVSDSDMEIDIDQDKFQELPNNLSNKDIVTIVYLLSENLLSKQAELEVTDSSTHNNLSSAAQSAHYTAKTLMSQLDHGILPDFVTANKQQDRPSPSRNETTHSRNTNDVRNSDKDRVVMRVDIPNGSNASRDKDNVPHAQSYKDRNATFNIQDGYHFSNNDLGRFISHIRNDQDQIIKNAS